jgi:hypothetical protein
MIDPEEESLQQFEDDIRYAEEFLERDQGIIEGVGMFCV